MQRVPKIVIGVAVLAGIVGIGVLIGEFGSSRQKPAGALEAHSTAGSNPAKPPSVSTPGSRAGTEPKHNQTRPAIAHIEPAPVQLITNWEEKVDAILTADTDETNKVAELFALFPRVPEDAKAEIAQHLVNLTEDQNYAPLGELLKDPKLPEPALDVLMSDVLNRPNSVKLPILLTVAKMPEHPKAEEAKEGLTLFLDEDFGNDWNKWQEKMIAWLNDNPD